MKLTGMQEQAQHTYTPLKETHSGNMNRHEMPFNTHELI
jgi:hypothetical protein